MVNECVGEEKEKLGGGGGGGEKSRAKALRQELRREEPTELQVGRCRWQKGIRKDAGSSLD